MKLEDILLLGLLGVGLYFLYGSQQLTKALSQPWVFGNPGTWVQQPDGSLLKVG